MVRRKRKNPGQFWVTLSEVEREIGSLVNSGSSPQNTGVNVSWREWLYGERSVLYGLSSAVSSGDGTEVVN